MKRLLKTFLAFGALALPGLLAGRGPLAQEGETPATTEQVPAAAEAKPASAAVASMSASELEKAERVGASACAACHEGYGEDAFKKTHHGLAFEKVKGKSFEESCETCHGPGSLHVAAGGDKEQPGFFSIVNPRRSSSDKANAACLDCHGGNKELQMWQVGIHKAEGLRCADCHGVHKAKEPGKAVTAKTEGCFTCHADKRLDFNMPSHHPVLEGKLDCSSCHNPHGGEFGNLRAESVQEMCFKCHAEKSGPFIQEHPPARENCALCHKPHGSANERLLAQSQPFLCMTCHKFPHTERSPNNSNAFRSADRFNVYGKCTNCHREIHGTDTGNRFR